MTTVTVRLWFDGQWHVRFLAPRALSAIEIHEPTREAVLFALQAAIAANLDTTDVVIEWDDAAESPLAREWLALSPDAFWGYAATETLDSQALIEEKYDGIRPAPGYPACPEHTEKRTLWELLDVENSTGIKLTESCAMWPAAEVSGWYFSHPESKYFTTGQLGKDQVEDYAERKGMTVEQAEKWLASVLNYDV